MQMALHNGLSGMRDDEREVLGHRDRPDVEDLDAVVALLIDRADESRSIQRRERSLLKELTVRALKPRNTNGGCDGGRQLRDPDGVLAAVRHVHREVRFAADWEHAGERFLLILRRR